MGEQEKKDFDLEAKRFDLEREKLEIEWEKLRIERSKKWHTSFSIFIPLLIACVTLIVNDYNERQRAEVEFQLKAAEVVTRFQDPDEMK